MASIGIAPYFTRADGGYAFARWGRPIVPVGFGVENATAARQALEVILQWAKGVIGWGAQRVVSRFCAPRWPR